MTDMSTARNIAVLTFAPDSGKPLLVPGDLDLATTGALLADLAIARRVTLEEATLRVVDTSPTGDVAVDEMVSTIASSAPRGTADWLSRLTPITHRWRVAQVAAATSNGGLIHETTSILRLFRSQRWRPAPGGWVEEVDREVAAAVTAPARRPGPVIAATVAILDATSVLPKRFPHARRDVVDALVRSPSPANGADDAVVAAITEVTTTALTMLLVATPATSAIPP